MKGLQKLFARFELVQVYCSVYDEYMSGTDPENSEREVEPHSTTHEHPLGYCAIPLKRQLPSNNF